MNRYVCKFKIFNDNEKIEEENTCTLYGELDGKIKAFTPCKHVYCVNCLGNVINIQPEIDSGHIVGMILTNLN